MSEPPLFHELSCVIHLHSTYSDGTGTVPEIAEAARHNGLDVVLLTDHDTLAAKRNGEERWYGSVLVLVGEEVSPPNRDHFLAFGIDEEISPRLDSAEICAAVEQHGGFGFAAHPFSKGSERFRREGMGWTDIDCDGLSGIEVWSLVTDTLETFTSIREALRFIFRPHRVIDNPPEHNLEEWDRLGQQRRIAGIGGIDAHQIGVRIAGRVPFKLMSYRRSFQFLHTHALTTELPTGDVDHDRAHVFEALRQGRSFIALDSLAPARGFRFWATQAETQLEMGEEAPTGSGWTLHATLPSPAQVRLVKDGRVALEAETAELEHEATEPGVWRIEARKNAHGKSRTWILSNPVYLRG